MVTILRDTPAHKTPKILRPYRAARPVTKWLFYGYLNLLFLGSTVSACSQGGAYGDGDGPLKGARCGTSLDPEGRKRKAAICDAVFDGTFEEAAASLVSTLHNPGVTFGLISAQRYIANQQDLPEDDLRQRLELLRLCAGWVIGASTTDLREPRDVSFTGWHSGLTNYLGLHPDRFNHKVRAGIAVRGRGTRVALPQTTGVKVQGSQGKQRIPEGEPVVLELPV